MLIDQDTHPSRISEFETMRVACEPIIHAIYDDLQAAVGSKRFCGIIEEAFSVDFVYTDPAVVLLGREAFASALGRLRTIRSVDRLEVRVRDLGSHAVVTGACALCRPQSSGSAYVFNALWRPEAGEWFCVAQRGSSALLSDGPVVR